MKGKFILSLFVSIFLVSLVSSLSIDNVNLGTVNAGETVPVNVIINNFLNSNTYNVEFNSSDVSLNDVSVPANSQVNVSANYAVPSGASGARSFVVEYDYTDVATSSGSFTVSMNVVVPQTLEMTTKQTLTLSQNGIVTVTNNGNTKINVALTSTGNADLTFNKSFSLNAGESKDVEISISSLSRMRFGNNPITITAKSGSASDSVTFNLVSSFCPAGEIGGNLSIDKVDISSNGDDDEEWKYLDQITVEVRVRNSGNDDVDNVNVELGLFDANGEDFISDLEFLNDDEEQIEVGDLNDGDKETVTFEFRVPADFDSGNYKLAVKAYSDEVSQSALCADESNDLSDDTYQSVSVEEEDDEGKFIGFDNVELSSDQFVCSESGTVSLEVFNIGEDDQDRVRVTLYNDALKIEQSYEIRNEFEVGDSQDISFDFTLPSNARDGNYQLHLNAEYDYRSGGYRQDLDEEYDIPITLLGCSNTGSSDRIASISAVSSEAEAGSEVTVDATIRNLADEEKTFTIRVEDYASWAELVDISDRTITLESGETADFTITLVAGDNAEGSESLTITAVADGESESREVLVEIAEQSRRFSFGGSSLLWIIAAVNLILILLIILVAVKLSRR